MGEKYFLSSVCIAFILGVFITWVFVSGQVLIGVLIFSGAIFFGARKLGLLWCLILILPFFLGGMRFFLLKEVVLDYGAEGFSGCIVSEVDVRSDKVKYVIKGDDGRVLVNGPRYPLYKFGDCLKVFGELEKPEKINDFEYGNYLARYGIYGVISRAHIALKSEGSGLLRRFFDFKNLFEARINRVFPEPYASFVAGLILGSRRGISPDLMEQFNTTGLTHIIAVSGYNITIVVLLVERLLGFLGRRFKVLFAALFVLFFVIFVGASAAVVRAGIMAGISLMAIWFGRNYFVVGAFFLTGALMALWNPLIIVYDIGFQLSFLATAAILFLVPRMEKWFMWLPTEYALRESFVITVAAQLVALPVIWANFGRFSLIAPLVNLLVLPFVPYAMLFGFVSILAGKAVGFFGYLVLNWIIAVVEFFAGFSWAALEGGIFLNWWAVIYYWLLVEFMLESGQ